MTVMEIQIEKHWVPVITALTIADYSAERNFKKEVRGHSFQIFGIKMKESGMTIQIFKMSH